MSLQNLPKIQTLNALSIIFLLFIFWSCAEDSPKLNTQQAFLDRKAFFEMQRKLELDTLISEADMLHFGKICARFGDSNTPFDSFKHPRIWVEDMVSLPPVGELIYKLGSSKSKENSFSFRDGTGNFYELDTALSTKTLLVYTPQPEQVNFQMRTLAPEKGDSLRMVLAYLYHKHAIFFGQTPKGDWKLFNTLYAFRRPVWRFNNRLAI